MRSNVYKHILDKYIHENCPCFKCQPPKRYGGCRTECEAWKIYEKEYAEYRDNLRTEQEDEHKKFTKAMCDAAIKNYQRRIGK